MMHYPKWGTIVEGYAMIQSAPGKSQAQYLLEHYRILCR